MPSTREIRRRIRSIGNIAKVTQAMETVAASKMRKAQQQVLQTRPYAEKSRDVLRDLARMRGATEQPLIQQRSVVKSVGLLLITGDRGLAGAYNSSVLREASGAIKQWQQEHKEVNVVTIGRKGRDWMLRHGPPLRAEFTGLSVRPTSNDISPVASILISDFVEGRFDEVHVAYTQFISTLRQEPLVSQLLPITPAEPDPNAGTADFIFEPDAASVLNEVLRGLTELMILQAVYESIASEESARMVAMRNATDAANDLIGDLTLTYNKARQESITKELLDIVGGASALGAARAR
jgi:F-type H+-transporting ATPase subunit gamma